MEATETEKQAQWERDQAERKAKRSYAATQLKILSGNIANYLGDGWKLREREDESEYDLWTEIKYLPKCTEMESDIQANYSLDIHHSTQGHKYHIGCGSVRTKAGYWETFGQFSINVSREKSAEQIARDIKRRLLPGYLVAFDAAVEKARARNQAADDTWATTRELAAIVGYAFRESEIENRRAELHCYKYHCDSVRINSADNIDIKLSCNRETARRVLELLKTIND